MLEVDIEKKIGSFFLKSKFTADENITGLLGASGCGKSMTLRCIAGVTKPDKGRIILDGTTLFDSDRKINLPPRERRVGYLFQNYALFPNMTIEKNILLGLNREKNKETKKKRLMEVMRLLEIEELKGRRPAELSGGQQQRAALGRILVGDPKLLMLDEPFSALDAYLREKLQIEIKGLLEKFGKPVLMVTHNRNEAYHLCAQIAVMKEGHILLKKNTKELFDAPVYRAAAEITGCKNIIDAKRLGDHEVFIPSWGISLLTEEELAPDVCAVGIRAHYFSPDIKENCFRIIKTDVLEETFEWIMQFRYTTQNEKSRDIWWRVSKSYDMEGTAGKREMFKVPSILGVLPSDVVPLYPEENS